MTHDHPTRAPGHNPARRHAVQALGMGLLGALLPAGSVLAQPAWPTKPVKFIVPFPPGGPVDTAARFVTKPLSERWGSVAAVIDNKAGAGGIVAARIAAREPADGYTFFFPAIHHAVHPSLRSDLGYDIQADFAPVGTVARFPIILCAHPSLGVRSVQALIDKAKENGKTITFSSSGTGGGTHLAGELFNSLAGVKLSHIPYRGSAPAMQDLVGGQVDLMFADAPSALPFIESGRIIPLGVGNPEPSVLAPNVPPIGKTVKGYEAYSWSALMAPKGTPPEIVTQLNRSLQDILNDPQIGPAMAAAGAEPMPGTPDDLARFLDNEIKKWARVIREANIQLQG